jgi:thioesterase domain-containing protein
MDSDQPYYELDYYGTDGGQRPVLKTVLEKAADFIQEIRSIQPTGPYYLGGFCFGGLVAVEMARQLEKEGEQVALLFLIDPSVPMNGGKPRRSRPTTLAGSIKKKLAAGISLIRSQVKRLICRTNLAIGRPLPEDLRRFYLSDLYQKAVQNHVPAPYSGQVTICYSGVERNPEAWQAFFTGTIDIHHLGSTHFALIEDPEKIRIWAQLLNAGLPGSP